jgi:translation initiation factor 2 alpha subunit (eIF-2alpha)
MLSSKKIDLQTKKSVHFNISKDAHAAFRIACFERGLSMQEVVEEFVQRILTENSHVIKLLDEVAENKKHKTKKRFSKTDVKSIFDMLEDNDPLGE